MDISSSLSNLLVGYVVNYLPFGDATMKMQAGMFLRDIIGKCSTMKMEDIWGYVSKGTRTNQLNVVISKYSFDAGYRKESVLYSRLTKLLMNKYPDQIQELALEINTNGEPDYVLRNLKNTQIDHSFQEQTIHIQYQEFKQSQPGVESTKTYCIKSSDNKMDTIKSFVSELLKDSTNSKLMTLTKKENNLTLLKSDKGQWNISHNVSYKTLDNTILDPVIEKQLINDIDFFLNSNEWYNTRGIPYNRGYLLYGPPGTGKTSVIKAIAQKYNLPIYMLDFTKINTNRKLNAVIDAMDTCNLPHILCMEDIDRIQLFDKYIEVKNDNSKEPTATQGANNKDEAQKTDFQEYDSMWQTKETEYNSECITVDCLLNIFDGLVEYQGRVLFITANQIEKLLMNREVMVALLRPGRIDKILEFGYITPAQLVKMVKTFYDIDMEVDIRLPNIVPAEVMYYMQLYPDDYESFMNGVLGNSDDDNFMITDLYDQYESTLQNWKEHNTKPNSKTITSKSTSGTKQNDNNVNYENMLKTPLTTFVNMNKNPPNTLPNLQMTSRRYDRPKSIMLNDSMMELSMSKWDY